MAHGSYSLTIASASKPSHPDAVTMIATIHQIKAARESPEQREDQVTIPREGESSQRPDPSLTNLKPTPAAPKTEYYQQAELSQPNS